MMKAVEIRRAQGWQNMPCIQFRLSPAGVAYKCHKLAYHEGNCCFAVACYCGDSLPAPLK